MSDVFAPAELVALAKDLNRQHCALSAKVNALRGQLFAAAQEARAKERASTTQRTPLRCAAPSATTATWHFGPKPDELDAQAACHLQELSRDARD